MDGPHIYHKDAHRRAIELQLFLHCFGAPVEKFARLELGGVGYLHIHSIRARKGTPIDRAADCVMYRACVCVAREDWEGPSVSRSENLPGVILNSSECFSW